MLVTFLCVYTSLCYGDSDEFTALRVYIAETFRDIVHLA